MAEPKFTPYQTVEGDRWDRIAKKAYRDETKFYNLINDNPGVAAGLTLPPGITIYVRIETDPVTGEDLPPWKTQAPPDTGETEEIDPSIPIVTNPTALGFYPGYPAVEGNKIKFAINKSDKFPYSVEKEGGSIVAESSLYDFTIGFPVFTSDITDGGRYRVKVGPLVSGYITVIGEVPAMFVQAPKFVPVGSVLNIQYSINKTGDYPVLVTRQTGSEVIQAHSIPHTNGAIVTIVVPAPDRYTIEVAGLTATVDAFVTTEVTDAPDWLNYVALSYSASTRACSIWVGASEDVEVKLERTDNQAIEGITWLSLPWSSSNYVSGTTDYAASPYTEVFRFNPIQDNTGGVAPGVSHRLRIRQEANPSEVFVLVFTAPVSNQLEPVQFEIDLPDLAACKRGPFIYGGTIDAHDTYISFFFDAEEVYVFKWRIRRVSDSVIVVAGVQNMTKPDGSPFFPVGNNPRVNFDKLAPDDYAFEMEGASCDSSSYVQIVNFTIEDETPPEVITGDVTPKVAMHGLPQHMNIVITGESEDWYLTDISTAESTPPTNYNNYVQVNSHYMMLGTGKLTSYHYESNDPCRIIKSRVRSDLTTLDGWDGTDWTNNHGAGFSRNTSVAFTIIVFNELE